MASSDTVIVLRRAEQMVFQYLPRGLVPGPMPSDAVEALEALQAAETYTEDARRKLGQLMARGAVTPKDITDYNAVRHNTFMAALRISSPIVAWLAQHYPEAARQIPPPRLAPDPDPVTGSMSGIRLGNPVAAGWAIAAIILSILAALLILATIATAIMFTAEAIRDVVVAREQSRQYATMLAERGRVYDDCRGSGGGADECAQTASRLVPTPANALPQLPPAPGSGLSWVATAAVALAVLGVVAGGVYLYKESQRTQRVRATMLMGFRNPRPERITAHPSTRRRRRYDLEVE